MERKSPVDAPEDRALKNLFDALELPFDADRAPEVFTRALAKLETRARVQPASRTPAPELLRESDRLFGGHET